MIDFGGRRRRRLAPGRRRRIGVALAVAVAVVGLAGSTRRAAAQPEDDDATAEESTSLPTVRLLPEDLLLPEGLGTFDLVLENGPPASVLTIWLYLDPERYSVTSITRGPLVSADGTTLAHELENGYLTLRATFASAPEDETFPIGDGPIARIGVAALEAGQGSIQFDGIELLDPDGAEVEATSAGTIAVDAVAAPGPEALEDAAAQATALAEAAVQGGLPDAAPSGLDLGRSLSRLVGGLGPRAAWLALLAVAAGITAVAWLIGREEAPSQPLWTMEAPDDHRRSVL